jgi:hypothetical protein
MAEISMAFDDRLRAPEIEELVARIEHRLREAHPEVVSVYIKPQDPQQFTKAVQRRFGDGADDMLDAAAPPDDGGAGSTRGLP